MHRSIAYTSLCILMFGCAAKSLNVGSDDGDPNNSGLNAYTSNKCADAATPITLPNYAAPDACVTGNELSAFVGQWDGYYQGSGMSDDNSTFHLNILGANATNGLCGTITYGVHPTPVTLPAATDPTADYPPAALNLGTSVNRPSSMPLMGVAYTLVNGRIDGQRIRFDVNTFEVFKSWCEIQSSYPADDSCLHFMCAPNMASRGSTDGSGPCYLIDPNTQQEYPYNCNQLNGCSAMDVCDCDAKHCTAGSMVTIPFDLLVSGDQATGKGSSYDVILNRLKP